MSVPASCSPALLRPWPGSLGLSKVVAAQSQGRVNAAFLPQKKLLRLGFLFLWLLLTWLGCLSRVLSLQLGRDLPGLWNSPAVPAALQRLILHHACPGATGTPLEPLPSPRWAGRGRAEGLLEASSSPGSNLTFPAAGLGGLPAGQEGLAARQEGPVAHAAAQGFGGFCV